MNSPKLLFDLHTHTTMSHGKGSARDNVERAIAMGLTKIGICDHGQGHLTYGISDIREYLLEIQKLKAEYSRRIQVLTGIELNMLSLNGHSDYPEKIADKFDYFIFGYHKLVETKTLKDTVHFYFRRNLKSSIKKNTQAYIKALSQGKFTILAHPGFSMKVFDARAVAECCAEHGVLIEINDSHAALGYNALKLDIEILKQMDVPGAKYIINSDAHRPERVGRYSYALEAARAAGIDLGRIVNLSNS